MYQSREHLLQVYTGWWVVDEPPVMAQAILVLGGDSIAGERVAKAVELFKQGWAPRLVLSGPNLRPYLNEADLMQREALGLGAPPEAIVLVRHQAESTQEEILLLRDFLAERNIRKLIVVTSNFHTRRTRTICRRILAPRGIEVHVKAAPCGEFNEASWWRQRTGKSLMFVEWLKTLNTWWELRRVSGSRVDPKAILRWPNSSEPECLRCCNIGFAS